MRTTRAVSKRSTNSAAHSLVGAQRNRSIGLDRIDHRKRGVALCVPLAGVTQPSTASPFRFSINAWLARQQIYGRTALTAAELIHWERAFGRWSYRRILSISSSAMRSRRRS